MHLPIPLPASPASQDEAAPFQLKDSPFLYSLSFIPIFFILLSFFFCHQALTLYCYVSSNNRYAQFFSILKKKKKSSNNNKIASTTPSPPLVLCLFWFYLSFIFPWLELFSVIISISYFPFTFQPNELWLLPSSQRSWPSWRTSDGCIALSTSLSVLNLTLPTTLSLKFTLPLASMTSLL